MHPLRQGRGGESAACLRLPSQVEINYRVRGPRRRKQPTSGVVRDPGRLNVTGLSESDCMFVERRDPRAP
jgi:hypothetical protein